MKIINFFKFCSHSFISFTKDNPFLSHSDYFLFCFGQKFAELTKFTFFVSITLLFEDFKLKSTNALQYSNFWLKNVNLASFLQKVT